MISLLRTHMRWLLIIVAVAVIISFVWFYQRADLAQINKERVATMFGREITRTEVQKLTRHFLLTQDLGLFELLGALAGRATSMEKAQEDFILNLLVLRDAAARMQIEPGVEEIKEAQRRLPAFQTDGAFDPAKLALFIQTSISPRGFTELQIDEAISDLLRYRAVKELVDGLVSLPAADVRTDWERINSLYSIGIVKLNSAAFLDGIQPAEEDMRKRYEIRKSSLLTPAKRQVAIASLPIPAEIRDQTGPDRITRLQTLADTAFETSQKVLEPGADFDAVTTAVGMAISKTETFTDDDTVEVLDKITGARDAVRLMNAEDRFSDVVQTPDSFTLLHLLQFEEPREMSLEEARPQIEAELKQEGAMQTLRESARELRSKLSADGPFSDAAAKNLADKAQKLERLPAFKLTEIPEQLRGSAAQVEAILALAPGAVSEPVAVADGVVLIALEKIDPPAADAFEQNRVSHSYNLLNRERSAAFATWLEDERTRAGLLLHNQANDAG